MKALLLTAIVFASAVCCNAATITVNWDGSGDYMTIQDGINAAVSGFDTVVVAEGTYVENISFNGKDIVLTSTDPEEPNVVADTIIDGGGVDTVVRFSGTETSDCKLLGFTITNGYGPADGDGGGISGAEGNASVANCIIKDNIAQRHGGGIRGAWGLIDRCIITGNSTINRNAGGISGCHGTISNCLIYNNTATLAGGGIVNCDGDIVNCTIADNTAGDGTGGLYLCDGTITNCIIWDNSGTVPDQITVSSAPTYSCIQNWTAGGTGNIVTDPNFAFPGEYHLLPGSPCIDAGDNNAVPVNIVTDLEGSPRFLDDLDTADTGNGTPPIVDMGTYEFVPLPTIVVWPSVFEFSELQDGTNPPNQILKVRNAGPGTINWQISETCDWLQVQPENGSSTGEIDEVTISIEIIGLDAGVYDCNLTVSDPCAMNNPQYVNVTLDITGPIIELSSSEFIFSAKENGPNPNDKILTVRNSGNGTLNWEITETCDWFTTNPASGNSAGEPNDVTLSVDISGLTWGEYNCELTVSDPCAMNSPQYVTATLQLADSNGLIVPWDYPTIQEAIDAAITGDEVVIVEGTYTGSGNRDLDFGGKAITVRSTDPNNPAVVAATVIDCEGSWTSRHRGFKFHSGEGRDSVVSGLTITKGDFSNISNSYGGGIYCSGSSPTIKKCIVTNNKARAGSDLYGENGFGGGIYCTSGSEPLIIECTITNNMARGGTGDDVWYGGIGFGGGIYCNSNSSPTIMNCIISGNTASGGDGAAFGWPGESDGGDGCGAGVYCNVNSNATIRNCIIADNTASGGDGGDGYEDGEVLYPGSGGDGLGGGVFCSTDSAVNIVSCTICCNMAIKGLGGDYGNGNPSHDDGYSRGGGVYQSSEIYNSILWGNIAEQSGQIWGSPTVSYSDIEGGFSGTGNIDTDPNFINPSLGDYHLGINSPCREAGDPSYLAEPGETDIDGEPRIMESYIDMGADEFNTGPPFIDILPEEFEFIVPEGGPNPDVEVLSISNGGGGVLDWLLEENCPWLEADPNNGSSAGDIDDVNVSVDVSGLLMGIYECDLTITAQDALNSPRVIPVTLFIGIEGELHVPAHYPTIQAAIDGAEEGDTIIVADGTYTSDGNRDIDFKGKAITLCSAGGPQVCIIDCQNPYPDHRAFYFHSGEGPDSVVSGFTIKRGRVGRDSPSNGRGAGIYCTGSSPSFDNCIITNNRASGDAYGGGIYSTSSSSTFVDCVISNNTTAGSWHARGGGVYGGNLTFVNCTISGNSASGARGDDEQGIPPSPANNGGDGYGGGCCGNGIKLVNCIITGNTSSGGAGGDGWEDGADGGWAYGASVYGNSLIIKNCFFSGNSASGGTGGNGDDIGVGGNGGSARGGAVYTDSANIRNCTIIDNSVIAGSGGSPGGASGTSSGGGIYGSSAIFDCIIWGNGDDLAGGASATYSCIEDNDSGTGNIHVDPMFVSGLLGDCYLSQIASGQASDSPCVDTGSDTAVKAGLDKYTTRTDKRGDEGIRDMGYHYTENIADLNDDGYVNITDVLIMALQWLDTPGIPSADIAPEAPDDFVNGLDFGLIQYNWQWP